MAFSGVGEKGPVLAHTFNEVSWHDEKDIIGKARFMQKYSQNIRNTK